MIENGTIVFIVAGHDPATPTGTSNRFEVAPALVSVDCAFPGRFCNVASYRRNVAVTSDTNASDPHSETEEALAPTSWVPAGKSFDVPVNCVLALLPGRIGIEIEIVLTPEEEQLRKVLETGGRPLWGTTRPFHYYSQYSWIASRARRFSRTGSLNSASSPSPGPPKPEMDRSEGAGECPEVVVLQPMHTEPIMVEGSRAERKAASYLKTISEAKDGIPSSAGKKIRYYYDYQTQLATTYTEVAKFQAEGKFHVLDNAVEFAAQDEEDEEDGEHGCKVKLAVRGSLCVNIVLLILKLITYIRSGSLAVLASLIDSFLDLFSGIVLLITAYLTAKEDDRDQYPTGKKAFEPLGVLIFSCAMFVAASQLLQESITKLIDINSLGLDVDYVTIGSMAFVVVAKSILYLYCKAHSDISESCGALADDHRNDVISNTLSIGSLLISKFYWKYCDPLVALLVTLYIMFVWARNSYDQLMALNGKTADPARLSLITFAAMNHHPDIVAVDTVRAVTTGGGYTCEVDIVLPREMLLQDAHDIGESLQLFLEKCPQLEVARAYVHIDYETEHSPWEHR